MHTRTLTRVTGIALATAALATCAGTAAAGPHMVSVSASLNVTAGGPPACHAGLCTIRNSGTGTMRHFGNVTFTTVITADGNQPPCGPRSQWVNRIVRRIHTGKGTLVLHEGGLQCPVSGVGPRVDAVWVVDGADSTGTFAAARGHGTDVAYPIGDTAAPRGTITLVK